MANKARSVAPLFFLFILLFLAGFAAWIFNTSQLERKARLHDAIETLKSEYPFARISVQSASQSSLGFKLTLIDSSGKTYASTNLFLKGNDVFLESKVAVLEYSGQQRAFVFPSRVYSDLIAPEEGVPLYALSAPGNLPAGYPSLAGDSGGQKFLKEVFTLAQSGSDDEEALTGISAKIILEMDAVLHPGGVWPLQAGKSYLATVHPNGGMEIREEGERP